MSSHFSFWYKIEEICILGSLNVHMSVQTVKWQFFFFFYTDGRYPVEAYMNSKYFQKSMKIIY